MTINAINGSAINKTAFPGSEEGLSLIELIGQVEAIGIISAVNLRLSAFATTAPKAVGSAESVKRSQIRVSAVPEAASYATANIKRMATASGQAVCAATAGVRVLYLQNAIAAGTAAQQPAYTYVAARNAGSVTAGAVAKTATARTVVSRGALVASIATGAAGVLRKTPCSAGLAATSVGLAGFVFKSRVSSSATPTATAFAATRVNVRRSAPVTAQAAVSATALRKILFRLVIRKAEAKCSSIATRRQLSFGAATQANAYTNVRIRTKYALAASIAATATAQTTAVDFASAMPAPTERLMTVQASDRRMGVTE